MIVFNPQTNPSVVAKSIRISQFTGKEFQEYYSEQVLQAGIKSGRFVSNYLKVNKHKPTMEAFVQNGSSENKGETKQSDILIHGTAYRYGLSNFIKSKSIRQIFCGQNFQYQLEISAVLSNEIFSSVFISSYTSQEKYFGSFVPLNFVR